PWSVFVLVFRRRVCRLESLGTGRLLGTDPDTTFFKCARGINNRAVDRNLGDDWNFSPANGPTLALFGSRCSLFRSVAGRLRCTLQVEHVRTFGSSFSPAALPDLGGGTIRHVGSKHCHFDYRLSGDLECISWPWAVLGRNA